MKKWMKILLSGLLYAGLLGYANLPAITSSPQKFQLGTGQMVETARILWAGEPVLTPGNGSSQPLEIQVSGGFFADEVFETSLILEEGVFREFQEGERIILNIFFRNGEIFLIQPRGLDRTPLLLGAVLVFAALMGLIGGKKGLRALAGLAFTMVSLVFILIPLMRQGYPVILLTLLLTLIVGYVTLQLIGGSREKVATALAGTLFGVMFALIFSTIISRLLHLTALDSHMTLQIVNLTEMTLRQGGDLFLSSVLIASLGAVMDTAVSVASALEEIRLARPGISPRKLFISGMNVGRDTMGSMSNTLILAFAGSSLGLMILLQVQEIPWRTWVNDPYIVMEIVRSLAGSSGIILTIPAVAATGAILMGQVPPNG